MCWLGARINGVKRCVDSLPPGFFRHGTSAIVRSAAPDHHGSITVSLACSCTVGVGFHAWATAPPELMPPRIPAFGKTMTQQHGRPSPLFRNVPADPVGFDDAVLYPRCTETPVRESSPRSGADIRCGGMSDESKELSLGAELEHVATDERGDTQRPDFV